jgi:predicted amidohydrolase YtcJ
MTTPRISTVVSGEVVIEARPDGLERAEAIGIADGRVVVTGTRRDVVEAAAPGARMMDMGQAAVMPGLHDFHLHLVGMARARREVRLDGVASREELVARVRDAGERLGAGRWLRGRGWSEAVMDAETVRQLGELVGERPALIYSHDAHSAWASAAALRAAGIDDLTQDPPGGRYERTANGDLTGVLRERAADLVESAAERLRGADLHPALEEVLAELAGWGITGATDAGDTTTEHGTGAWAALGDRASLLLEAAGRIDGRLRLTVNLPADAIQAAGRLGLRTGPGIPGTSTLRGGWAKVYADGALGSQTAALFAPYTCRPGDDAGILRLDEDELQAIVARGRGVEIGVAVHAIGDRAVAAVLAALEVAGPRAAGQPPDRMEHLQLVRPEDRPRLGRLDVTASLQPVHAVADRELVERCWSDRTEHAYPLRSLADAGSRLAFGSDAPVETPNPWHGIHAALHRRAPDEPADVPGWLRNEAITAEAALSAYTLGPAQAAGHRDEGNLRPGAQADLAVLNTDLETLLAGERVAETRSLLTMVAGHEVHRA